MAAVQKRPLLKGSMQNPAFIYDLVMLFILHYDVVYVHCSDCLCVCSSGTLWSSIMWVWKNRIRNSRSWSESALVSKPECGPDTVSHHISASLSDHDYTDKSKHPPRRNRPRIRFCAMTKMGLKLSTKPETKSNSPKLPWFFSFHNTFFVWSISLVLTRRNSISVDSVISSS